MSIAEAIRWINDALQGAAGVVTYPAAAAPANAVSFAEVLRRIYDLLAGTGTDASFDARLGKRVDRATADIVTGAAVPVYTVAVGRVMLVAMYAEVTTAVGAGATNASFQFNPTAAGATVAMCATLDIDADPAGTLYSMDGVFGNALKRGETGAIGGLTVQGIILKPGDIEFLTDANRTSSIALQAWYIPLDDGATMVAA